MGDFIGLLIEAPAMLRSRLLTALLIIVAVAIAGLETHALATGLWWNVGSAPPGTGCRYWTGTKMIYRAELDGSNCPVNMSGRRDGNTWGE